MVRSKEFFLTFFFNEYLGKGFILVLTIVINSFQSVRSSNCPLLRSFTDHSGSLLVNKTAMMHTDSPVHCQWLIASPSHQVINERFMMNFKIKLVFNVLDDCSRI